MRKFHHNRSVICVTFFVENITLKESILNFYESFGIPLFSGIFQYLSVYTFSVTNSFSMEDSVVQTACHIKRLNENSKSKILSTVNLESQDTIL